MHGTLAAPNLKATSEALSQAGQNIGTLLLNPLWSELKDKPRWVLALQGSLATLPVHLLPVPGEASVSVIDRYETSYVNHAREVLKFGEKTERTDAVIIAAPDFDAALPAAQEDSSQRALEGILWRALPGARDEALALAKYFKEQQVPLTMKLGSEASKEALLQLKGPRYLHIATHGFFLPDTMSESSELASRGLAGIVPNAKNVNAWFEGIACPKCHKIHDELLRSGLALAGANKGRLGQSLITAQELMHLNLQGTQLVVLSACETGLGVSTVAEGVLGLRRSFINSGAQTLVASLWKIPDAETKELMTSFYAKRLEGQSTASALRRSMLELRDKRPGGSAHPFYWGAFVLIGDPR